MAPTRSANDRYKLMEKLGMETLSGEEWMTAIANWLSDAELEEFLTCYFGYDTEEDEDDSDDASEEDAVELGI